MLTIYYNEVGEYDMRRFLISILAIVVFSTAGICFYIGTVGKQINSTIIFETSGGKKIDDYVGIKDTVVELPIPEREGYSFDGWYEAGVKVSNSYILTKDTKLIAKWNINTCKVNFNALNNKEIEPINVMEGSTIDFPEEPTMDHYKFIGWTLEDGTLVDKEYIVKKDVNLIAKWEEIK